MADTTGYDKISEVIGRRINENFLQLFKDLTAGDISTFTASGITSADLENFFASLGGANIAVQFTPKVVKGTQDQFIAGSFTFAPSVDGTGASVLGFEGSCGGRWTF
jgi:hypothetical protein